ncbi:MAG: hypothetical protein LBM95_02910 [Lactobacillales bacterium]|jgi:hypothetical protein|nr:hypothetical protein [Lactobacillales bacterium]
MKGYVLKGMERVDFQLSSQAMMINESREAEERLTTLREEYSEIEWEIIDFKSLEDNLEKSHQEVVLALTNSSIPYRSFFEKTYPTLKIIDVEEKNVFYDSRYENVMIITIVMTYLILFLRIVFSH